MKLSRELKSILWSLSARLGTKLLDFVTLIYLARSLSPSDFGLVALSTSVVVIIETITEIPLISILLKYKDINDKAIDTAFTLNLFRGVFLAIACCLISFPVASFFEDSRIESIVLLISLAPIARSLNSPALVKKMKIHDFRGVFISEVVGKVIGSILAAVMLCFNFTYWSIVAASVCSPVVTTACSYVVAPYVPRLSLDRFDDFKKFLGWYSVGQIFSAASWQSDKVFIGTFSSNSVVGSYSIANDLSVIPSQLLIGPAMRPFMAALSNSQNSSFALKEVFQKWLIMTALVTIPIAAVIFVEAEFIIKFMFGEKWNGAGRFLTYLSIAAISSSLLQPIYATCAVLDKPRDIFNIRFFEAVLRIFLFVIAAGYSSVFGILCARLFVAATTIGYGIWISSRLLKISLRFLLSKLAIILFSTLVMGSQIIWLETLLKVSNRSTVIIVLCSCLSGLVTYIIMNSLPMIVRMITIKIKSLH